MNQSTAVDAYYASYCAHYANPNPNSSSDLQTHESLAIALPPPPGVVDTTPYYTLDTNAQNLAWQESVRQPHSLYPPDAGFSWTGHIVQAQLPGLKKLSKKAMVVRSAYCEVYSSLPGPTVAVPLIGPQENPNPSKSKARKKGVESITEDLETKRRRVVECGVSNESIRLCRICNVVCNSDTVYNDQIWPVRSTPLRQQRPL
ncbi:unnamed protein product [Arabidopsis halleri]